MTLPYHFTVVPLTSETGSDASRSYGRWKRHSQQRARIFRSWWVEGTAELTNLAPQYDGRPLAHCWLLLIVLKNFNAKGKVIHIAHFRSNGVQLFSIRRRFRFAGEQYAHFSLWAARTTSYSHPTCRHSLWPSMALPGSGARSGDIGIVSIYANSRQLASFLLVMRHQWLRWWYNHGHFAPCEWPASTRRKGQCINMLIAIATEEQETRQGSGWKFGWRCCLWTSFFKTLS